MAWVLSRKPTAYFHNTLFQEHLQMAASEKNENLKETQTIDDDDDDDDDDDNDKLFLWYG